MNHKISKVIPILCGLTIVLLISGCTDKLRRIDDKLGEGFEKAEEAGLGNLSGLFGPDDKNSGVAAVPGESGTTTPAMAASTTPEELERIAGELTLGLKEKIDVWLEENGLNRYGDPENTMYTGGTPLFNEATGESIDRFEYILKKHPEIINILK